jgi:hypothetical protein
MQVIAHSRNLPTVLLAVLAACGAADAQSRKALLVGIAKYMEKPATPLALWQPHGFRNIPVMGTAGRRSIPELSGPPNDVATMKRLLIDRYRFRDGDIDVLEDSRATADAIIQHFRDVLIQGAGKNDIRVFYFSGHGSRMTNRSPEAKADHLDETIVPADSLLGVPDIRDKELGRLYRAAAATGAKLTVIQDSCYSGTASRGMATPRDVEPNQEEWVVDPPAGQPEPQFSAEKLGVLVVSASQNDQTSAEMMLDGRIQGLFTWALNKVLWTTPDERMDRVTVKVRNLMAAQPQAALEMGQEPLLGGAGRMQVGLLGETPNSDRAAAAIVRDKPSPELVDLTGGPATGIFPGCELVRIGKSAVTVRVTQTLDPYGSQAEPIDGSFLGDVSINDEFKVTRWSAPPQAALRVYVPPALSRPRLEAAVKEFSSVGRANTAWVQGKDRAGATHFLSWRGETQGWVLGQPESPAVIRLGPDARVTELRAALPAAGPVKLLLIAPPTDELAAALSLGSQSAVGAAVEVLPQPDSSADYSLEGQVRADGHLEYAWVIANLPAVERGVSPYPALTAWVLADPGLAESAKAGERLSTLAARLGRVRAWLRLENPHDEILFPYHLDVLEPGTLKSVGNRPLVDGERLKLALVADGDQLAEYKRHGTPPAYVYVFLMDSEGTGVLFFPDPSAGGMNKLPVLSVTDPKADPAPAWFPLTKADYDVEISEPFGTDCYFLLVTSQPIPDPTILDFQGVGGDRGTRRGGGDPLADLLLGVGNSRAATRGVPTEWRVEWRPYQSVPKKK